MPARKRFITRSRWSCDSPPCSASALVAAAASVSVSSSTSVRVRQNTSARVGDLEVEHAAERGHLVRALHEVGDLAHPRAAPARGFSRAMSTRTGSRRCLSAMAAMRGGSVAEKSAVCRCAGVASRIASRSSAKPMSSISSASSSTTVSERLQQQRAAAEVVERAARRGHDHVDAALQGLRLAAESAPP